MHADHRRLKRHADAGTDYPTLVAGLMAGQSVSAGASAQTHHHVVRSLNNNPAQAIVTLLQAKPGWRAAANVLAGSFHPGVAGLIADNGS